VILQQRFPHGEPIETRRLLREIGIEPEGGPLTLGDPRVVDFLVTLAKKLLSPAVARRFPELGSLGFFLRRTELDRAIASVTEASEKVLRFPRGTVFHVPPANVDTIFVYSWALSALAGNANVVRISSRSAGAADAVLEALNATLATAHPAIAQTQRMVTYGHDDAITAELSLGCDLRVIWGGDGSVNEIRRHPLRPWARDVTFPDRSSFAVLATKAWQTATPQQKRDVAIGLYNDSYWFDQAACSSPRTLYWVGAPDPTEKAQRELFDLLSTVIDEKAHRVDAAMAVQKRVSTYGLAAEGAAKRIDFSGNAIATVELAEPGLIPRRWLGVGTFPQARVDSIEELIRIVERRDQTVTHFGFAAAELTGFARAVAGRGVDRFVPIGDALSFASIWDGFDLLREFSKLTTIQA